MLRIPILNPKPFVTGLVEPIVGGVKRQGKTVSIESLTHQYLPISALATIYCQSMALVPLDRFATPKHPFTLLLVDFPCNAKDPNMTALKLGHRETT